MAGGFNAAMSGVFFAVETVVTERNMNRDREKKDDASWNGTTTTKMSKATSKKEARYRLDTQIVLLLVAAVVSAAVIQVISLTPYPLTPYPTLPYPSTYPTLPYPTQPNPTPCGRADLGARPCPAAPGSPHRRRICVPHRARRRGYSPEHDLPPTHVSRRGNYANSGTRCCTWQTRVPWVR